MRILKLETLSLELLTQETVDMSQSEFLGIKMLKKDSYFDYVDEVLRDEEAFYNYQQILKGHGGTAYPLFYINETKCFRLRIDGADFDFPSNWSIFSGFKSNESNLSYRRLSLQSDVDHLCKLINLSMPTPVDVFFMLICGVVSVCIVPEEMGAVFEEEVLRGFDNSKAEFREMALAA